MHIFACGFFTAVSEDLANQLLVLAGVGKVGSAGMPCNMESECLVVWCYVRLTGPPPVIKDIVDVFRRCSLRAAQVPLKPVGLVCRGGRNGGPYLWVGLITTKRLKTT